ncbi:DUF262 domain-containing protein [Serratia marcescens]|nr:DUF262 domain-containing protein [Serratia marcescens]ELQ9442404.1 DUF262 domain-containing protein [Serratia marcescens]ELT5563188.1 DUF262 domain-containing protein [Serratia marcescens]
MNFQAEPVTINALLSVSKQYFIPRYQREFSWTKENIDELWSDLVNSVSSTESGYDCEEYFIGTLVLAGRDDNFEIEVVDGQQRLTVITMFISALCRALNSAGEVRAAQSTFETYIKGIDRRGNEFAKLDKRSTTNFFQLLVQDLEPHQCEPQSEEDSLVKNAFDQITRLVGNPSLKNIFGLTGGVSNEKYIEILNVLIDLIVDHLKVIRVNVLNSDDAYTIFEILNARGINLSPVDLIKNKVLQEWGTTYPIDFAKNRWNGIVATLSSREVSVGLEEYTIHHWTTKFAYTSKRNLYKAFKKQWDAGNLIAEDYLQELYYDSLTYIKIVSPLATDWPQADQREIFNSLSALRVFNVSIMRSFLLSLFKARQMRFVRQAQLIESLGKIEKFHFMFNAICSLRPSGIEGLYAKSARNLSSAVDTREAREVIDELLTTLEQKKPTQENFVDKFAKLQFVNGNTSHKKLIQYIFIKFERSLRNSNEFEPSDLSLEHILSQSTPNVDETIIGSIGNLLPLGQSLNGQANVGNFSAKKQIYQQSDFRIVQEFLASETQSDWVVDNIIDRTNTLAQRAYNDVWN